MEFGCPECENKNWGELLSTFPELPRIYNLLQKVLLTSRLKLDEHGSVKGKTTLFFHDNKDSLLLFGSSSLDFDSRSFRANEIRPTNNDHLDLYPSTVPNPQR